MPSSLLAFALNTPEFKYTVLILATPLWWPFLKALWSEFNDILAEEGGLFGRPPDEKELRAIRRRKAAEEANLVRELRQTEEPSSGRRPGMGARAGFGPSMPRRDARGPRADRRKGFGTPR